MRYMRRGVSKVFFVPTIASLAAPTVTEIGAGTDLSAAANAIEGWTFSDSRISEPVLANRFSPQIGGESTAGDASITIHDDDGNAGPDATALAAAYTALADGTAGYVVMTKGAATATKKAEVFPVQVVGRNAQWSTGNEMAKVQVAFAITGVPAKDAVIAA